MLQGAVPFSRGAAGSERGTRPIPRKKTPLRTLIGMLETEISEDALSLLILILENAPIGFAYLDTNLRYRLVNEELANINGLSVEDHYGKTVKEVIPSHAQSAVERMKEVMRTGKPALNIEFAGMTKNEPRRHKYWRESFYPIRTAEGKTIGLGAIVVDITRRKHNERFREEFFRMASHEIKNPLTSVKAYAQLVQANLRNAKDIRNAELVSRIENSADKIKYLINTLMDATKTESGQMTHNCSKFLIDDVVREAVRDSFFMSKKHKILLSGKTGIAVYADRERILQVIYNLLSNAVKYSPQGGDVRVSIGKEDEENVKVCVRDQGIGIEADKLKSVFNKYYRAHGEAGSGLGLGLYIASHIVRHYKGKIWVKSKPGKGSTFCFSLPAVP